MPFGESQTWRIFIPTRDGARWLGPLIRNYNAAKLNPLYVYDARSSDDTYAILCDHGCDVVVYTGEGETFVEGGILQFGANRCGTPWVLRMDDDEFPALALVSFLSTLSEKTDVDAYFISTRELFRRNGRIFYSRHRYRYWCSAYGSYLNPHLRLFKPDKIEFIQKLHSPGIEAAGRILFAPEAAYHAHFSSVLRSASERLAKVRRYDSLNLAYPVVTHTH